MTVGVTLGGLILAATRGLRQDMVRDMARLEDSTNGLLEGLREAISGRAAAS